MPRGRAEEDAGDEEMRSLVEVLPMCSKLALLDISFSFDTLTAEGVGVLTRAVDDGKLPAALKEIMWMFIHSDSELNPGVDCSKELRAACKRRGVELEGNGLR